MFYLKEPLRLYGEGDFALTDVKEMDGTPGFLDLDVGVKMCQNSETVLECKAKAYLNAGKEKCKCVPHHLRSFSSQVSFSYKQIINTRQGISKSVSGTTIFQFKNAAYRVHEPKLQASKPVRVCTKLFFSLFKIFVQMWNAHIVHRVQLMVDIAL